MTRRAVAAVLAALVLLTVAGAGAAASAGGVRRQRCTRPPGVHDRRGRARLRRAARRVRRLRVEPSRWSPRDASRPVVSATPQRPRGDSGHPVRDRLRHASPSRPWPSCSWSTPAGWTSRRRCATTSPSSRSPTRGSTTSPCGTCCSRPADSTTSPAVPCWPRPPTAPRWRRSPSSRTPSSPRRPGETWRYANANYVLAGLVVERASGLSYGDYVQREIFTPLGMTHSSASTDPVGGDVLADGHRFWFGVPVGDRTDPAGRHPRRRVRDLDRSRPGPLPVDVPG